MRDSNEHKHGTPEYYHAWFVKMSSSRSENIKRKVEQEEHFYCDVDGTATQFTQVQLKYIQQKYDIPVSTKIGYSVIEQILAMLTGSKPYPRIIASSENPESKMFAETCQRAHAAIWYESMGDEQLSLALRDCLITGSGYLHVRNNYFYGETTFNVVCEHVPWWMIYVDPLSKRKNFTDAEMMCIAETLPLTRAEKEFDIDLDKEDSLGGSLFATMEYATDMPMERGFNTGSPFSGNSLRSDTFVWKRIFYEKRIVPVYILDDGKVVFARPKPAMIANPELEMVAGQMAQLQSKMSEMQQQAEQGASAQGELSKQSQEAESPQAMAEAESGKQQLSENDAALEGQMVEMDAQLNELAEHLRKLPDQVQGFIATTDTGEQIETEAFTSIKRKQVEQVLMIGRRIIERKILSTDEYPIHHFCTSHFGSPHRTYGVKHYIMDHEKASNKFLSAAIYDAQMNGRSRVLVPKGSLMDLAKFEQSWSIPGSVIEYEPNELLPEGGMPHQVEPSPLNQTHIQLMQQSIQMIEYVTGINSFIQGNPQDAPSSFGATQQMAVLGTQRIKLYARYIETTLKELAYTIVSYIQHYAPRNAIGMYFDENGDGQEVAMLDIPKDMKFRVRSTIASSLPTARHEAAQLLATISGQTSNPAVADLLTQKALQVMDVPEATELISKIDVVNQMQQQIQQLQGQLDESEKKNRSWENQVQQQNMSAARSVAKAEAAKEQTEGQLAEAEEAEPAAEEPVEEDMFANLPE